MFALVDCNNFFVSCERVFKPGLNNNPVVVLSNNDGCVISRSNEAKALGVPMGAPYFKYKDLFKKNCVEVFSSNYVLYGDMSQRVMSTLSSFTPKTEIYSIDEAFLNFEGFEKHYDLSLYGKFIRKTVFKNVGIPTSIGIAPTKTLAKLAANIAKKFPQLEGCHLIDSPEKKEKALKWTHIKDVWGIGYGYSKKMDLWEIKTAYDFPQLSDSFVRKEVEVQGLKTKKELEGVSCLSIEREDKLRGAVATTRTFSTTITELEKLEQIISNFTINCAKKIRQEKALCNYITVYLKTDIHKKTHKSFNKKIAIKLPSASNSNIDLIHYAKKGLVSIFEEGIKYKRAGVVLYGITSDKDVQLNMFHQTERHKDLMVAIDKLNHKIGHHKVRIAAQGTGKVWQMKQERLSRKYSTHWTDLLEVGS